MLVLHSYVCRFQRPLERLQRRPWITMTAARCAIKLYGSMQHRRVNCQVACCNECIDTYSSPHNVVSHAIDERILCFGFRQLHVCISNSFQSDVQQQFVIEKTRSTSMECCNYLSVSVRSSGQFLYSRSSVKISDFYIRLYNSNLSVALFFFQANEKFSSPYSSAWSQNSVRTPTENQFVTDRTYVFFWFSKSRGNSIREWLNCLKDFFHERIACRILRDNVTHVSYFESSDHKSFFL